MALQRNAFSSVLEESKTIVRSSLLQKMPCQVPFSYDIWQRDFLSRVPAGSKGHVPLLQNNEQLLMITGSRSEQWYMKCPVVFQRINKLKRGIPYGIDTTASILQFLGHAVKTQEEALGACPAFLQLPSCFIRSGSEDISFSKPEQYQQQSGKAWRWLNNI